MLGLVLVLVSEKEMEILLEEELDFDLVLLESGLDFESVDE